MDLNSIVLGSVSTIVILAILGHLTEKIRKRKWAPYHRMWAPYHRMMDYAECLYIECKKKVREANMALSDGDENSFDRLRGEAHLMKAKADEVFEMAKEMSPNRDKKSEGM
jgi:hypothetical protein